MVHLALSNLFGNVLFILNTRVDFPVVNPIYQIFVIYSSESFTQSMIISSCKYPSLDDDTIQLTSLNGIHLALSNLVRNVLIILDTFNFSRQSYWPFRHSIWLIQLDAISQSCKCLFHDEVTIQLTSLDSTFGTVKTLSTTTDILLCLQSQQISSYGRPSCIRGNCSTSIT